MSTPEIVEVYRNLTRKAWSVRVAGRVVGHVPAIALRDVVLLASEASRLRCVRLGVRDVHAFARGARFAAERQAEAVRIRYRPHVEGGFRLSNGAIVSAAAALWLEADGSAWCLADRGASIPEGRDPMVTMTRYPTQTFDLAHLDSAGLLDEWALQPERRGDGYVLVGLDEQGRERETGCVQGLDADAGWAWVTGAGLLRLGSPRHANPTTGVTL